MAVLQRPSTRESFVHLEIQRVIYFTENVEAMSRFYREVLGFEPIAGGDGGWQEFKAGGCNIALHRGKPSAGARGPKVVFYSTDVAASRAALLKRGASDLGKVISGDDLTLCDGRDPDGNPFQISTRKR
ncbi:VOC family protein [Methylobacterium sp. Leaf106]|uniref:VOC family protein n=1 Tax=Methylobacterium sp. Leaf106 TaxID=1736255 RepID=UPI0023795D9D|nr:VOC family protein [Methylobacterium sp. Leaf106]